MDGAAGILRLSQPTAAGRRQLARPRSWTSMDEGGGASAGENPARHPQFRRRRVEDRHPQVHRPAAGRSAPESDTPDGGYLPAGAARVRPSRTDRGTSRRRPGGSGVARRAPGRWHALPDRYVTPRGCRGSRQCRRPRAPDPGDDPHRGGDGSGAAHLGWIRPKVGRPRGQDSPGFLPKRSEPSPRVLFDDLVRRQGLTPDLARERLLRTEPFHDYPDLVAALPTP